MSLTPVVPPFLSDQSSPSVLWCYTGGGHFFDEIFAQINRINQESIPICFVFSNAGALVANRYGFFWKLANTDIKKGLLHFIFEKAVARYNIKKILQEADFSYSVIQHDPAFSAAVTLANWEVKCILVCPLTANTAAKLAIGITDTLLSNLLASGLKSGKKIAVFPTDVLSQRIKTKLPTRQIKPASSSHINTAVCKFNALKKTPTNQIQFLPQYCVGCQKCVENYPNVFTYGDEIVYRIREIDSNNIKKLSSEVTVIKKVGDIYPFIRKIFQ